MSARGGKGHKGGGGNQMAHHHLRPRKQRFSIVLRDPTEIPHRKGVNTLAIAD